MMSVFSKQRPGFTVIEVIVVFLLMVVLSLAALVRITDTGAELIGDHDRLLAHIRYAQSRAIRTQSTWTIDFSGSSTYQLEQDGTPRFLPGLDTPSITIGSSITASDLNFNSWGEPVNDSGQLIGSAGTVSVTDGSDSLHITIERDTGYVHD